MCAGSSLSLIFCSCLSDAPYIGWVALLAPPCLLLCKRRQKEYVFIHSSTKPTIGFVAWDAGLSLGDLLANMEQSGVWHGVGGQESTLLLIRYNYMRMDECANPLENLWSTRPEFNLRSREAA